jgi:hypothetical protein
MNTWRCANKNTWVLTCHSNAGSSSVSPNDTRTVQKNRPWMHTNAYLPSPPPPPSFPLDPSPRPSTRHQLRMPRPPRFSCYVKTWTYAPAFGPSVVLSYMLSRSISFLALLFHVLEAHPPVLFNSSLLCQDISYLECRYNIMNGELCCNTQ